MVRFITVLVVMSFVLQKLNENSVFDDVVQDVSGRCPSIDLPWLNTEIGLADIQQTVEKCARLDDKCKQAADTDSNQSDKMSLCVETSEVAAVSCKQVADYSHLYIYKRNVGVTASRSQKTVEYLSLIHI